MGIPLEDKSTPDEIRRRFDADVERFSNLQTGQSATMDAPLAMSLITSAAIRVTQPIQRVLDLGCGAGNNTIKLRQELDHDFAADLLDLSRPMLARAQQRLREINTGPITLLQTDVREATLAEESYDVILAAAVLHHLRGEEEWRDVFGKLFRALRPGDSFWITDLVSQETAELQELMTERYSAYLSELGGDDYRDRVLAYIDQEDSPRPVTFQLELLRQVGFARVELLHKNACFAAFGAVKGSAPGATR